MGSMLARLWKDFTGFLCDLGLHRWEIVFNIEVIPARRSSGLPPMEVSHTRWKCRRCGMVVAEAE